MPLKEGNVGFNLSMTEQDKARLIEAAKAHNMRVSDYVRSLIERDAGFKFEIAQPGGYRGKRTAKRST